MKHMIRADAKCPYYKHEDSQVIYCYGIQEDSVIHLAFSNRTDSYNFKKQRCCSEYKKCPIMRMLEENDVS